MSGTTLSCSCSQFRVGGFSFVKLLFNAAFCVQDSEVQRFMLIKFHDINVHFKLSSH